MVSRMRLQIPSMRIFMKRADRRSGLVPPAFGFVLLRHERAV